MKQKHYEKLFGLMDKFTDSCENDCLSDTELAQMLVEQALRLYCVDELQRFGGVVNAITPDMIGEVYDRLFKEGCLDIDHDGCHEAMCGPTEDTIQERQKILDARMAESVKKVRARMREKLTASRVEGLSPPLPEDHSEERAE